MFTFRDWSNLTYLHERSQLNKSRHSWVWYSYYIWELLEPNILQATHNIPDTKRITKYLLSVIWKIHYCTHSDLSAAVFLNLNGAKFQNININLCARTAMRQWKWTHPSDSSIEEFTTVTFTLAYLPWMYNRPFRIAVTYPPMPLSQSHQHTPHRTGTRQQPHNSSIPSHYELDQIL